MMRLAAVLGLVALAVQTPVAAQQTDTTFAAPAGGRLSIEAINGSVVVRTWERDEIRLRATHPATARVQVRRRGSEVMVDAYGSRGVDAHVAYDIVVPRTYSLVIDGVNTKATVDGLNGRVRISNAQGDITVRNVTGDVEVESVGGALVMESVRGRIDASTVNQTVRLTDTRGDVEASTVNGGIVMRNVDARRVEASTVNGSIEYMGAIHDGGRYYLGAHVGQITMGVPANGNARVSVSTRMGRVETDFPVPAGSLRDGRLSFTLGSGSASVELESFNGAVRLVRPRTQ